MEAAPPDSGAGTEGQPPVGRGTVPVGVGAPLLPFRATATVNACALVMVAAEGVTESAGVAFWLRIATVTAPEAPPPGAGGVTCTLNWPGFAISEACTWQVSEVLLTNVVVRGFPLIETADALVKPLPVNC